MARKPSSSKRREDRRKRLYRQQGGICAGCKQPKQLEEMTFDHVFPQSKHDDLTPRQRRRLTRQQGRRIRHKDDYRNIELLCRPCNAFKADHFPWDWNAYVWDQHTQSLKSREEINQIYHKKHKKEKDV